MTIEHLGELDEFVKTIIRQCLMSLWTHPQGTRFTNSRVRALEAVLGVGQVESGQVELEVEVY